MDNYHNTGQCDHAFPAGHLLLLDHSIDGWRDGSGLPLTGIVDCNDQHTCFQPGYDLYDIRYFVPSVLANTETMESRIPPTQPRTESLVDNINIHDLDGHTADTRTSNDEILHLRRFFSSDKPSTEPRVEVLFWDHDRSNPHRPSASAPALWNFSTTSNGAGTCIVPASNEDFVDILSSSPHSRNSQSVSYLDYDREVWKTQKATHPVPIKPGRPTLLCNYHLASQLSVNWADVKEFTGYDHKPSKRYAPYSATRSTLPSGKKGSSGGKKSVGKMLAALKLVDSAEKALDTPMKTEGSKEVKANTTSGRLSHESETWLSSIATKEIEWELNKGQKDSSDACSIKTASYEHIESFDFDISRDPEGCFDGFRPSSFTL